MLQLVSITVNNLSDCNLGKTKLIVERSAGDEPYVPVRTDPGLNQTLLEISELSEELSCAHEIAMGISEISCTFLRLIAFEYLYEYEDF